MNGLWVMVCGPSGAGKDSTLAWAQAALAQHPRIVFARRMVTRPAGPGSDHDAVSPAELQRLQAEQGLAWSWQAHGYRYGVAARYTQQVAAGRIVVVNGSREHVATLWGQPDVRCVLVTAPEPVLAGRLHARGREDAAAVARRISRNAALLPLQVHRVIVNDADLARAGEALAGYLRELCA